MSLLNVEVMSEAVLFSGTDSVSITYDFKKVPFVTATSSAHNVNVYVESITNSGCTIRTSTPINGTVHVHIIGNK
jgi:hypothetical protein